jgi:hypothetical protein
MDGWRCLAYIENGLPPDIEKTELLQKLQSLDRGIDEEPTRLRRFQNLESFV